MPVYARVLLCVVAIACIVMGVEINVETAHKSWIDNSINQYAQMLMFAGFVVICFSLIPSKQKKKSTTKKDEAPVSQTSAPKAVVADPASSPKPKKEPEQNRQVLEEEFLIDDDEFSAI